MLRKQTAISHNLEDNILGIRPISAAFIYHCEHDILSVQDGVSATSLRLLANIAGDSNCGDNNGDKTDMIQRSMLSCPFITGDLMFPESDRSYLEARRLALTQNHLKRNIRIHGVLHTMALAFLLLLAVLDIILAKYDFFLPLTPTAYFTLISYFEFIEIVASFCFSLWLFLAKFCLKDRLGLYKQRSILYRRTTILMIYYPLILCSSIIQILLNIIIDSSMNDVDDDGNITVLLIKRYHEVLTPVLHIINYIIPTVIIVHVFVYCCMSECKFRVHRWEWIFIDFLCRKNYHHFDKDDEISEILVVDRDGEVVETNVVPDTAGIITVDERTPLLRPV